MESQEYFCFFRKPVSSLSFFSFLKKEISSKVVHHSERTLCTIRRRRKGGNFSFSSFGGSAILVVPLGKEQDPDA